MSGFMDALMKRRSVYSLGSALPIPEAELSALVTQIVQNTPSAFNMQSQRAILLLGSHHKKLWDTIVLPTLQEVTPAQNFAATQQKIQSFAAACGTILYFDDTAITNQHIAKFPLYKDLFPDWALQQNGMLQCAMWTALAEKNIGASLQHYNPLIDEMVSAQYHLPASWRLLAQMPFGSIQASPVEKSFLPVEERLRIFT